MLDKERLIALRDRQLSLIAKLSQSCDRDVDQVNVGRLHGNIASSAGQYYICNICSFIVSYACRMKKQEGENQITRLG